jgi:hypothetical protein
VGRFLPVSTLPDMDGGRDIDRGRGHGLDVAKHIVCVDCGGLCHLLSHEPPEGWEPDDVVAYRCEDCLDRWDIVLEDEDNDPYG